MNSVTQLKIYIILLLFGLSFSGYSQVVTRFPYVVNLKSGAVPPGVILPTGSGTNSAQFITNGLQLTNSQSQFGAIILNNVQFQSTNGIEIEIEYSMFGGVTFDGNFGDGFSLFLFDGSVTADIGHRGASLGYRFNRTSANDSNRGRGLNGAYLGVGFDQFGNFKANFFQSDARANGFRTSSGDSWTNNSYQSHITLRGAQLNGGISGTDLGLRGNRYSGYPLLYTRTTRATTNPFGGKILNISNGAFQNIAPLSVGNTFELRNGVFTDNPLSPNYRKAFVKLFPAYPLSGFLVTVEIQHGLTRTKVIDNFHYPETLTYIENANSNGIDNATTERLAAGANSTHVLNSSVPNTFKIGLAGSTGGASQTQVISSLVVKIPYLPELLDDSINQCVNYKKSITFNPFANDKVYNGVITSPSSGNTSSFIDYNSFLFEDENGTVLGATSYNQPGIGLWTYNATLGEVTFTPESNFIGTSFIHYSVKGLNTNNGPFGQDIYRSTSTKMEVNVKNCNAISNPSLPSKAKN